MRTSRPGRGDPPVTHRPHGSPRDLPGPPVQPFPPTLEFATASAPRSRPARPATPSARARSSAPSGGSRRRSSKSWPSSVHRHPSPNESNGPGLGGRAGERPGALGDHRGRPADRLVTERHFLSPLPPRRFDTAYRDPAGSTSPCRSSSGTPCATRCRRRASARWWVPGSRWTRASSRSPGAEGRSAPTASSTPPTTTCGTRSTAGTPRRPPSAHQDAVVPGAAPSRARPHPSPTTTWPPRPRGPLRASGRWHP